MSFIMGAFIFQFCSSTKKVTATDEAGSVKLVAKTFYLTDVKPLLAANCTPCHFPPKGRIEPLDSYASAKENIDNIISRIEKNPNENGFMPLKHPKLSDSVINVFKQWKLDGLAE